MSRYLFRAGFLTALIACFGFASSSTTTGGIFLNCPATVGLYANLLGYRICQIKVTTAVNPSCGSVNTTPSFNSHCLHDRS